MKTAPKPIRKALKEVMNRLRFARDTGNRPLQAECRGFLRENIRKRNHNLQVIFHP